MKHYILIHGAWHGKWVFDKIINNLQKNGLQVVALDLPGHYSNYTTDSFSNITLQSYVNYVTNFIEKNSLYNVSLVGHSMAGAVISQVGQNIPQHIAQLVYLAAFIPAKNCSIADEEAKAKLPQLALHTIVDKKKCSINITKEAAKEFFYQLCNGQDRRIALSKLQAQPLLPLLEKVSLGSNFDNLYKIYIECLHDQAIDIADQRRMNNICNQIITLNSDHSPFFSTPAALCRALQTLDLLRK